MADPLLRVELTASFLARLGVIEVFLGEADAAPSFDRRGRAPAVGAAPTRTLLPVRPTLDRHFGCARALMVNNHVQRNHMSNEAFARVKIDALLASQGWDTLDTGRTS